MINYILLVIYIYGCVGGWVAVYICIYLYIYLFIHTYIYTFFFINLIVKSIETFVVCAVSRIKLLLLLLLVRKQDFYNKNMTQGELWKHNTKKCVRLYTLHILGNKVDGAGLCYNVYIFLTFCE